MDTISQLASGKMAANTAVAPPPVGRTEYLLQLAERLCRKLDETHHNLDVVYGVEQHDLGEKSALVPTPNQGHHSALALQLSRVEDMIDALINRTFSL